MNALHRPPIEDPDPFNPAIPPLEPDRGPVDPVIPDPMDEPVIEPVALKPSA